MADRSDIKTKQTKKEYFINGCNLPPLNRFDEERRFEVGDEVPTLTPAERKALIAMGCISELKPDVEPENPHKWQQDEEVEDGD